MPPSGSYMLYSLRAASRWCHRGADARSGSKDSEAGIQRIRSEPAPRVRKEKTSSIRGGTRFWGPIELAENKLGASEQFAMFFFAILAKNDGA
jgi:hypothetical protein